MPSGTPFLNMKVTISYDILMTCSFGSTIYIFSTYYFQLYLIQQYTLFGLQPFPTSFRISAIGFNFIPIRVTNLHTINNIEGGSQNVMHELAHPLIEVEVVSLTNNYFGQQVIHS